MRTRFGRNTTCSSGTLYLAAAKAPSRALIVWAAFFAAIALRSVPEEAAVAEVLGTFAVVVGVIFTRSRSIWNSSATTWATLTNSPCPISVPPWFSWTEPSL
jgi:hypothetical protein